MSLLLCRFLGIPLTPDTDNRYTDQSFAHYILSIAGELRLQIHTTGLYAGVFAALGLAGLLWVMAEKWQNGSEWDRQDAIWMISFEALLALSAILYRVGANSTVTRKFAMAGSMADVFGIGVALSVPAILWFHWHKPSPKKRKHDDEDSLSTFQYSRTILGLQDYSPPPSPPITPILQVTEPKQSIAAEALPVMHPAASLPAGWLEKTIQEQREKKEEQRGNEAIAMEKLQDFPPSFPPPAAILPVTEPKEIVAVEPLAAMQPLVSQPAGWLEQTLQEHEQSEKKEEQPSNEAIVMENMNILSIDSQPPTSTQQPAQAHPEPAAAPPFAVQAAAAVEPVMSQSYTPQPAAPQPVASQPPAYQPMTAPPPASERPSTPTANFRDQLFALNNSWQRIESTGKEVEDWFQNQQRRVMAHLERPIAKGRDNVDFSRDFLEQRMERIDAEWAAIHQTVRNLHRWLENGSLEKEAPQESKVW